MGFFGDTSSLFDLSALVSTLVTTMCHNDDLFEVRNRCDAHFALPWSRTCIAIGWEGHQLLLSASLVVFVFLIINWFWEVDRHCSNTLITLIFLCICFHLLKQSFLLFLGLFYRSWWGQSYRSCSWFGVLWLILDRFECFGVGGVLFCLDCRFVNIVSHSGVIFNRPEEGGLGKARIDSRFERILNVTIAWGVYDFKSPRQKVPISHVRKFLNESVKLCCGFRIKLSPLCLQIADSFNCAQQKSFNSLDGAFLGLWWNLKSNFWNTNRGKFALDHRSIQSFFFFDV